jgi:Zn-dependent metalloprotease
VKEAEKVEMSLDVIGHELTHGVVQYEAGLIYLGESRALNKSFADAFGSPGNSVHLTRIQKKPTG